MTFGSLFAGIGGFDLGFERAGMECKWQVEIDPYCQKVLAKHWPHVRRHDDVRTFPPTDADEWRVDVICGGFPCQDISYCGPGDGIDGERSGLFYEAVRVIRTLGPRIVVLENVAALLTRGIDRVLGTLAEVGFDAEWHCIPAAAVGAPHIRDRIFILGYASSAAGEWHARGFLATKAGKCEPWKFDGHMPDGFEYASQSSGGGVVSNPDRKQLENRRQSSEFASDSEGDSDANCEPPFWLAESRSQRRHWLAEPAVGRVANGIPARVDRLRGLGNAVVPQVAEWLGRRLMEQER